MPFDPYSDVALGNPLPVKTVSGVYSAQDPVSESNPLPVMLVDLATYNRLLPVSETNPLPMMETAGSYSRYFDVSDTNPLPVVMVDGESYLPELPVSLTNPLPSYGLATDSYADNETPAGTVNGTDGTDGNDTFTLAHTPSPAGSLELFKNGLLLLAGGLDYTLSAGTITFASGAIPITGDVLLAFYRY